MMLAAALLMVSALGQSGAEASDPTAPCSSPEYRQLDFWVGTWDLEFTRPDGTLGKAENVITNDEFGRCVILERFRLPKGGVGGADYIGTSVSAYDSKSRDWRQTWVDNGGGIFALRGGPVVGRRHSFELITVEPRGKDNRTFRMIWEDVSPNALTWRWQAQKSDGTWEDQWVLRYRRRSPSG